MSCLENKSEINYESAKMLHNKGNYPSVSHCTYYSCYQLIKHIWIHSMNKSDAELKLVIEQYKNKKAQEKGSHNVLINLVSEYIKENNLSDFRVINSNIMQLKRLRYQSDYEDKLVYHNDSLNSLDLAEKIRVVLKKY